MSEKQEIELIEEKKETTIYKGLNTILLSAIGIGVTLNLAFNYKISETQTWQGNEIVRLDTNQKAVMEVVKEMKKEDEAIKKDVNSIRSEWIESLKQWTEQNYIRKPQK